jgi:hypothetical protein
MNFAVKRAQKEMKKMMMRRQECAVHFQLVVKQLSPWIDIATFLVAFHKCARQLLKVFFK